MRSKYIRTGLITAAAVLFVVGTAAAGGDKMSEAASPKTDDTKEGADPLKTGAGTEQPKTSSDAQAPGPKNRPAPGN